MSDERLIVEFKEFLEDQILKSWLQSYLEGDLEVKALVKAAVDTLEQSYETEED